MRNITGRTEIAIALNQYPTIKLNLDNFDKDGSIAR